MLALLLALASGQVPEKPGPVAVLITSKRTGAEAFAQKLSGRIHSIVQQELGALPVLDSAAALKRIQASGFSDPKKCQGGRKCVVKLALLLGPSAVVVSVDVGRVQKSLAVHLEAVSALGAEPLAVGDFSAVTDEWTDQLAVPITVFSRALAVKLSPPPPTPPVAAQPESKPELKAEPAPVAPAPAVVAELAAPPPRSRSRLAPWLSVVGSVLVLGTSGAFAAMGNYDQGVIARSMTMLDGRTVSTLTPGELEGLAARGNQRYTIAVACAIASGVLLALAALLFAAG